ncbi:6156_t:CDS:1, partial [Paraglomus occultum]
RFKEQKEELQNRLKEVGNKLTNSTREITKLQIKLKAVESSLADCQTSLKTKSKGLVQSQAELENLKKRYQKELNSAQENQA